MKKYLLRAVIKTVSKTEYRVLVDMDIQMHEEQVDRFLAILGLASWGNSVTVTVTEQPLSTKENQ